MLMNGAVLKKKSSRKKESSGKGSLYSKLIIRNMKDDKARVIITVVIIAFSTMLIGMGMSMNLAFTGMIDKQTTEVAKYDFIMNVSNKVNDEKTKELVKVLDSEGVDYLPANISSLMYKWDGNVNAMRMICADPERLGDFYAVTDPKTGEPVKIPDDGILIQHRMHESFNMNKGDKLTVMDSSLVEKEVEVKGYFTNYYGRMSIASPAVYKSIFGEYGDANSYYIKLEGADEDEVKDKLLAVTDGISFSGKSSIKVQLESSSQLYNIMVVVITAMAIFISFMILTNLSNIFLNRRKRELSVMRVNGFSVRQARGYLSKETVVTTIAGLVLGVILGAILTPPVITILQATDLALVKDFNVIAWAFAVGIETIFAIVINSLVFRKVKDLDLKDIAS
jgi:ABC-type lipoprotein release transport system permease subunit